MAVRPVDDRPDQAAGRVVQVDEYLADDCSSEEGDDPVRTVQPGVGDEAGYQALVDRTPVAQRGPDVVRTGVDDDFLANGSHAPKRFRTGPSSS